MCVVVMQISTACTARNLLLDDKSNGSIASNDVVYFNSKAFCHEASTSCKADNESS